MSSASQHRTALGAAASAAALVLFAAALGGPAAARTPQFAAACPPAAISAAQPALHKLDVWRNSTAYSFPFAGETSRGVGPVIWSKGPSSYRRTHYPSPNLPSCRVGRRGTEDRMSRKAGAYFEDLAAVDGARSYQLVDSFGRPVTTIEWKDVSPWPSRPARWGYFVGGRWAGHGAVRAFEIQGSGCKLALDPVTQSWVRDPNYALVAFNPVLGSPSRDARPRHTSTLKVRAFVDRRALPGWANYLAGVYDFGCGETALAPMLPPQTAGRYVFKSGYGPNRSYLIGQYFGERTTYPNSIPGETRPHNNMPYSAYSAKSQLANSAYVTINTTGVAGGGMVRGLVRANVDSLTVYDEMTYCDPNYTLKHMLLRRNGKRVSKWSYFPYAFFSPGNKPTVRWVFGAFAPDPASLGADPSLAAAANANPASRRLLAWMPIYCDR